MNLQWRLMEKEKVKLRIFGMSCDDCVTTVGSGLKEQDGVLDVKISLKDGIGEVDIDPSVIKPDMLLKNRVFTKPSQYRAILVDEQ